MSDPITIKKESQGENGSSSTTSSTSTLATNSTNGTSIQEGEDEENYEDSLDLDMSKEGTKVWLVRLPKFLMEKWRNVESNSGKELGKVRICNTSSASNKKEVCTVFLRIFTFHSSVY